MCAYLRVELHACTCKSVCLLLSVLGRQLSFHWKEEEDGCVCCLFLTALLSDPRSAWAAVFWGAEYKAGRNSVHKAAQVRETWQHYWLNFWDGTSEREGHAKIQQVSRRADMCVCVCVCLCVFAWRRERNKEMLLCIGVAQLRANAGKIQQSRRWKMHRSCTCGKQIGVV